MVCVYFKGCLPSGLCFPALVCGLFYVCTCTCNHIDIQIQASSQAPGVDIQIQALSQAPGIQIQASSQAPGVFVDARGVQIQASSQASGVVGRCRSASSCATTCPPTLYDGLLSSANSRVRLYTYKQITKKTYVWHL